MAANLGALLLSPAAWVLHIVRVVFPPASPSTPRLLVADSNNKVDAEPQQLVDAGPHCQRQGNSNDDGLNFCEDVRIWHSARLAICAADPSRPVFNPFTSEGDESSAPRGRLMVYMLDEPNSIFELSLDTCENWPQNRPFHPLGLGILDVRPGAEAVVAVVNYEQSRACIEMFRLVINNKAQPLSANSFALQHIRSMENDSCITSPNAVVPLGEDHVLFTESFGFNPRQHPLLYKLEQVTAYPGGSVRSLYVNPRDGRVECTTLVSGISLANGLILSDDRRLMAVAGCTSHTIHIYDVRIDPETKRIDRRQQVVHRETLPVGFLPDNLSFVPPAPVPQHIGADDNGSGGGTQRDEVLLVAGHPSALTYLKTAKTHGKHMSGSKVVRISIPRAPASSFPSSGTAASRKLGTMFRRTMPERVKVVFEDRGTFYGTSSTANAFAKVPGSTGYDLLINGLWEHGVLRCSNVDLS